MKKLPDYIAVNKQTWNQKTAVHLKADFYDVPGFLAGKSSLHSIELDLLGDLNHKKVLHLQCHFGQDSLSLARLGAEVTGVDFSDKAIEQAQSFAQKLQLDATFVCCDLYDAPHHINEKFDVVFTSYGTIGWLPDLDQWDCRKQKVTTAPAPIYLTSHLFLMTFDECFAFATASFCGRVGRK